MLKHMLPLLLCAALLLCSCSQSQKANTGEASDTAEKVTEPSRLVIEDAFLPYTEEDFETLSARLTEALRRTVYLSRGIALSSEQKTKWKEDMRTRRLPAAEARKIPAATLKALLTEIETALTDWEAAAQADTLSPQSILKDFFADTLQLLGADDAGMLAYDNVLFFLDDSILNAEETYEKTGYQIYSEQANAYRLLQRELSEEVGAPVFSKICAAMFFGDTLLSRLLSDTPSASLDTLTDAEQVMLLQKQAEGLLTDAVTARQWQITLRVFDCISDKADLLDGNLTALQSGVLNACFTDAYLNAAGETMPEAIAFYAATVRTLSAEELRAIKSSDPNTRAAAVCGLLLRDEAAFRKIANRLSASLASSSDAEQKKLNRYWSSYLTYRDGIAPTDLNALITAMKAHRDTCTDATRTVLADAAEAYLFGIVPYVTFAFFH